MNTEEDDLEKILTDAGYIVIDKTEVLKIFPPPTDSIQEAVKHAPKHWP